MKRFFLLSLFAIASLSSAELDLQFQSRFNPIGTVLTRFTRIVPDGQNGFYAAGILGADAVIARFDAQGNMIAHRAFDHPYMSIDSVHYLNRDTQGRLIVWVVSNSHFNSSSWNAIVQYSPTLQQNWEYIHESVPPTISEAIKGVDMLDSGETAFSQYTQQGPIIGVLNTHGQLMFSRQFSGQAVLQSICDVPTSDSSRGFAISGRKERQGWIGRVNLAGDILYSVSDTAMAGGDVGLKFIAADESGVVSATGEAGSGGSSFYKVTPAGVITQAFDNLSLASPQGPTVILNATTARSQGGAIVEFDRNTLTALRRYNIPDPNTTRHAENTGGTLMAGGQNNRFYEWSGPGSPLQLNTLMHGLDGATLSGGRAQFVGWNPLTNHAAISTTRSPDFVEHKEFPIPGHAHRSYVDSQIGPTGEIALLSRVAKVVTDQIIPTPILLANYNASGKLKFSRAIYNFSASRVIPLEDGSFVVSGSLDSDRTRPMLVRVNAAGAITSTRVYNFNAPINSGFQVTRIPGSADVMLLVMRGTGKMALCRVRPDGSLAYNISYAQGDSGTRILPLESGKIAMLHVVDETNGTAVRIIDPASGLPISSKIIASEAGRGLIDIPGPAMAMVSRFSGAVRVRRIDESTGQITHFAELAGREFTAIGTGPTGRIAVVTKQQNLFKTMVYNGTNLSAAHAEITAPASVSGVSEVTLTNANHVYMVASESSSAACWLAKYSATGSLTKEVRGEGSGEKIFATNVALWLTGHVYTRHKGSGPYASRYSR